MEKLVQSTISSLGCLDKNGVYLKEPDCFENIRDLIRLLHSDNDKLTVRQMCLSNNIVKNDLIPIMKAKDTKDELFDAALRLTVNLCQPTLLIFKGKLPEENESWKLFYGNERNLAKCLLAFSDYVIFDVFSEKCTKFFNSEWEDQTEKQKLLVERILVLIRYVFAIGTEVGRYMKIPELEGPLKSRMLLGFFKSKFPALFLNLSQRPMEREFNLYVLSILSLSLKNFDAATLGLNKEMYIDMEKKKTEKELENLIVIRKREEHAARFGSSRGFLKGTFVVKGINALAPSNALVVQKSGINNHEISPIAKLVKRKTKKNFLKNKRLANLDEANLNFEKNELDVELKEIVKDFCLKLLNENAYNKLMKTTQDIALSNQRSLNHKYSEIYYFSLAHFMLNFARISKISCVKVSETFSKEFLHCLITYIEINSEKMKVNKENVRIYILNMLHAFNVYKEVLKMLNLTLNSENVEEKKLSNDLCNQLFQVEEYREMIFLVMDCLKPLSSTKKTVENLIIANHYFIHIMEKQLKSGNLNKVKKLKRKIKRRKKVEKKNDNKTKSSNIDLTRNCVEPSKEELENMWSLISNKVMDVLNGKEPENDDISPINILLKVDDEQYQVFALLQIQIALRENKINDAIGIYHAARTLWPDTGTFGNNAMTVDEEFNELYLLFFNDLSEISVVYKKKMKEVYGISDFEHNKTDEKIDLLEKIEESHEDEYEDEINDKSLSKNEQTNYDIVEVTFEFDKYVKKFAKPHVIQWYVYFLKNFEENSVELNKAILKIMHRIAVDQNSPSYFYLATLFSTFQKVDVLLKKWPVDERKKHKFYDIYLFGLQLLKKFFVHFQERGSVLICELLFYKTDQDAFEIEHGYGSYEIEKEQKNILWTEELENELKNLYNEYNAIEKESESVDIVNFIKYNLSKNISEKQIIRKLKEFNLSAVSLKRTRKPNFQNVLSNEDLSKFTEYVKEFETNQENSKIDLVDFLKKKFDKKISRQKIIKQLFYIGINHTSLNKKKRHSNDSDNDSVSKIKKLKLDINDDNNQLQTNFYFKDTIVQKTVNQSNSSSDSDDNLDDFFKSQRNL